jgi:hypothetical protein
VPIFEKRHTFLMDLNLQTMEITSKCLGFDFKYSQTEEYFHDAPGFHDFRKLANGKKDEIQLEPYNQVFADRHGWLNNLSILDLLCNEGRRALDYLKRQSV